jgi:NADH-quinone oxidoreductase subunit H
MTESIRLIISIAIAFAYALGTAAILIWLERKILADIQMRLGPTAHGPYGLMQLVFDGIKLIGKEDIIPANADKLLFIIAPFIVFVPALATFTVIPLYKTIIVRDLDIGIFYVFAAATLMPVGIIVAGWASYNKYSMIGGIRAAAQQISYEVPLLLSTMGVIMCAGSLSTVKIVEAQSSVWFIVLQPFGFIFFFIIMLAELNRSPFDMPEAESEIIAGYFTEYSGFRFAFFLFAEYMMLFAMSAMVTVLFLGGWYSPLMGLAGYIPHNLLFLVNGPISGIFWFMAKTYFIIFLTMWIRGTVPRVRIDQLMDLSWKVLLPLNLANIMATAVVITIVRPFK